MSNILIHSEAGVRAARRHPALKGLRHLARGTFCSVYDKGDTVLKLTCDRIQYAFSAEGLAPTGPYFPRLIKDYGLVGETRVGLPIYLMEMEKLDKMRGAPAETRKLARELMRETEALYLTNYHHTRLAKVREVDRARYASVATLQEVVDESTTLPGDMCEALDEVRQFISNYDAGMDMHTGNLMRRGDQLVLNDVVCDSAAVLKYFF